MELVGPRQRLLSTSIAGIFFAVGEIILGGLAYCIRDYRYLQLAISLPAIIFIVYYWYGDNALFTSYGTVGSKYLG